MSKCRPAPPSLWGAPAGPIEDEGAAVILVRGPAAGGMLEFHDEGSVLFPSLILVMMTDEVLISPDPAEVVRQVDESCWRNVPPLHLGHRSLAARRS